MFKEKKYIWLKIAKKSSYDAKHLKSREKNTKIHSHW